MRNIGILLAGGIGSRFKSNIPKQYMKLNGQEIISYSINAFKQSQKLNKFIVVVGEREYEEGLIENKYDVECITGGDTRNASLNKALAHIQKHYPKCEKVFIHEAARPFITSENIDTYIDLLDDGDAVITASPITDSLGFGNNSYVNREDYCLIQAPECFWFKTLKEHFDPKSIITGTVHQLPETARVIKFEGLRYNLKITYPEDLFMAEQFIKIKYYQDVKNLNIGNGDGKKYFIFGGNGGIGRAFIQHLKEKNIPYKAPSSQELNLVDITIEKLDSYLGDYVPDVIINTAGAYANDSEGILENYDLIMDVNLKSNLVLLEYAKRIQKRVNIVLISSSSSTKGRKNLTVYSASKVALNSIVESLAEELKKQGIIVNVLIPEKVNTPLIGRLHNGNINKEELLNAEDVAKAILHYSTCEEYGQLVHLRKGMC
ncbi:MULTISPECIES: SDR family NAD(P)-dependent oxidoreductase [Lysinibacillus]|uniref:SDR family NAD(P)-dependent oxidoreductase n=1 Tax=Lysinibacillus TaxID=400634 RepID=UPI000824715F|nr:MULTISPECIES: SDR family NAD(P)-dependent oxidoreductase [Lysinibacillus]MEC1305742.1 SDR family NAD(P)-dependent oxidoreductase [Lysinibacillus capsici]OCX65245.1 hypothetical protein BFM98_06525 [Lysinibacillus sp. AR18-8]